MRVSDTAHRAAAHVPADLARRLGQAYGMDGLRLDSLLPVTGRNVNAILTDERAVRYAARCHLRNPNRARITFQLDFQRHLRTAGLPVPKIIRSVDDEQIVVIGSASWVLFEHIDGSGHDQESAAERASAARCLNAFHEAGHSFAGTAIEDDTIPDLRRWWTNGANDIDDLSAMFARRGVDGELEFLRRWHARLTSELPVEDVDQLPTAWVHGDYHGDNLAFRDGTVVGIFDLDVVHHSWRLDDIARALFYFARSSDSSRIDHARAEAFTEAFGLSDLERAALPEFAVAVHARTAPRYRIREREGADPAAVLRRHVARMRSIAAVLPL